MRTNPLHLPKAYIVLPDGIRRADVLRRPSKDAQFYRIRFRVGGETRIHTVINPKLLHRSLAAAVAAQRQLEHGERVGP